MTRIYKMILLMTLVCVSMFCSADNAYQIEVIVFSDTSDYTERNRHLTPITTEKSATLAPSTTVSDILPETLPPLTLLPQSMLFAKNSAAQIAENDEYQLLSHLGWQQILYPKRRHSQPVYLESNNLEGTIHIYGDAPKARARIHLRVQVPAADGRTEWVELKRKVWLKTDEPLYLDHPKFGALIQRQELDQTVTANWRQTEL